MLSFNSSQIPPVAPRCCYTQTGYSKSKALLYKFAYTPSLSAVLPTIQKVQILFCIVVCLTLIPNKIVEPLLAYINRIKPLQVLLKLAGGVIAIPLLAAAAALYIAIKFKTLLLVFLGLKVIAATYLYLTQPSTATHHAHLKRTVEQLIDSNRLEKALQEIKKIKDLEKSDAQEMNDTLLMRLLEKYIEKRSENLNLQDLQDLILYISAQHRDVIDLYPNLNPYHPHIQDAQERQHLTFIQTFNTTCAKKIYHTTHNPELVYPLLPIAGNKRIPFLIDQAIVQIEECRNRNQKRTSIIVESVSTILPALAQIISEYVGHTFHDTIFISDAALYSDRCLNRAFSAFHDTDPTLQERFNNVVVKFYNEECQLTDYASERQKFTEKMAPLTIDWEANSIGINPAQRKAKARIHALLSC